jgi:hypothetical protein
LGDLAKNFAECRPRHLAFRDLLDIVRERPFLDERAYELSMEAIPNVADVDHLSHVRTCHMCVTCGSKAPE